MPSVQIDSVDKMLDNDSRRWGNLYLTFMKLISYLSHLACVFQVTIFCSRDHYKVFVNGEETHTFNHRFTKLGETDVLEVSGDMQLTSVQP